MERSGIRGMAWVKRGDRLGFRFAPSGLHLGRTLAPESTFSEKCFKCLRFFLIRKKNPRSAVVAEAGFLTNADRLLLSAERGLRLRITHRTLYDAGGEHTETNQHGQQHQRIWLTFSHYMTSLPLEILF